MSKQYTIIVNDDGTSGCFDGYHTFDELYDHRCLLFINICLLMPSIAYWRPHLKGWPLLGLDTLFGQISYHVPEKYLPLFEHAIQQGGPEWDGHQSDDVLKRLQQLAERERNAQ